MTKFHFRLASVLRLREMQLEAEEERLQIMLGELARNEQLLAAVTEERAAAVTFVQNQPAVNNADLRMLSAFLLGTGTKAAHLRDGIQHLKDSVAQQRQRITYARRNEQLLVKLKEKKFSEWRAQQDRELENLAQESWTAVQNIRRRSR